MNPLVKLHVGLFRYLRMELPKKKNITEIVKFLIQIAKAYLSELLKLYKNLFLILDPTYQAKRKEFEKYQKIKTDLQRCVKMLNYLDKQMEKEGIPRWKRRQFWRDFYANGQVRKDAFDNLLKEIG